MRPSTDLGTESVRTFGDPGAREQGKRPAFQKGPQIPRVHEVIQADFLQALFHPLHHLRIGIVAAIDQTDIGAALLPHLEQLHAQAGGFHAPPDHGHIDADRLRKTLPGAPEVVFRGWLPDGTEAESLDPQCHPFGAAVDEQHSKARSDELDQLFKAPELFLVPCHEQLLTQAVRHQAGRDFLPCQQPVQIRGCPQDQGLVVHQPFKHHKGQLVALYLQTG